MPGLPVDRNAIKNALLARIAAVTFTTAINGFTTWAVPPSRRLKMWTAVDKTKQPQAFLVQHRETYQTYGAARLVRRYLDMGVWCYAPTGDESVVGDNLLDLMESGLEAQLGPDHPDGELTLGGLVSWCRIDRTDNLFERDPGDIDDQALLVLPIRILIP